MVLTTACSTTETAATSAAPAPSTSTTTTVAAPPPTVATTVWTEPSVPTTIPSAVPPTTTTTKPPLDPPTFETVDTINLISEFAGFTSRGMYRWQQYVPEIEDVRITSTADGTEQPALWLPPDGDGERPLLVILHSWSSNYVQHAGIPYAMWAQENGWAVIAPNFRGRNSGPEQIGSEAAVQDAVDAIDFAVAQGGVDPGRVFVVGYSGGGMMGLLLAGRHPDKVTAVAAWGAVFDLAAFYARSRSAGRHYGWEISSACGGDPRVEGPAQDECLLRSPMTYLEGAREAGVAVFLGHGLGDTILSPRQSAQAFNVLADPGDRFTEEQIAAFGRRQVPEDLTMDPEIETFFGPGDPEVLYARHSADVWIVYFRANHEMVYQAAMRWFATDPP